MTPDLSQAETRKRLLRQRAEQLARRQEVQAAEAQLEVVVFELGREPYALEMHHVREVVPLKDLAPVPFTPAFVLGVTSVRGEIVPVIDLRHLFGMPERGLRNVTRAVIVRDGVLELGVLADVVLGLRTVPAAAIGAPPPGFTGIQAGLLRGVSPDGLIVLDAAAVLAECAALVHASAGA